MGAVGFGLLLAYLLWERGRERLGAFYLSAALVFTSVVPIVGYATVLRLRLASGVDAQAATAQSWILVILLMVPLLLVAWQHGFRRVLWFCAAITVLDLLLNLPITSAEGVPAATVIVIALVRCLFLLPVGYAMTRLAMAQRAKQDKLAQANDRLIRHGAVLEQLATSRERNRLARELHDTLAHTLGGLAVQLEAMNALWNAHREAARVMLGEALVTTRSGLKEARRAVEALRATPLEDLGLPMALRELAQPIAARAGVALELQLPERIDPGFQDVEHAVYRVAEEALTNAARHADARRLTLALERDAASLTLTLPTTDGASTAPRCPCRGITAYRACTSARS